MPRHPGGERYELQLVALADDAPAIIRLRHVLKALLRHYGFRAEFVRDVTTKPLAVTPAVPSVVTQAAAGDDKPTVSSP